MGLSISERSECLRKKLTSQPRVLDMIKRDRSSALNDLKYAALGYNIISTLYTIIAFYQL